jgi:molybdate transport system substrate-binding protein
MNRLWLASMVTVLATSTGFAADAPAVRLHSAGSLRAAMTDIVAAYSSAYGASVEPVYGASGGLGDRLAKGEAGDVFTSADMGYPEALTKAGISGPTVLFARNHLCAILRPGLPATPKTVLATLLRPDVKIGTSSPDNDPGGAYAWAMFKKADVAMPGSRAKLEAKALRMGSAPGGQLSVPPNTKNAMVWLFQEKKLDAFLSYCTNGHAAEEQMPGINTVELPPELAITADYGLTVLKSANQQQAAQFALFILSPAGQKVLAEHGFDAPLQPQ